MRSVHRTGQGRGVAFWIADDGPSARRRRRHKELAVPSRPQQSARRRGGRPWDNREPRSPALRRWFHPPFVPPRCERNAVEVDVWAVTAGRAAVVGGPVRVPDCHGQSESFVEGRHGVHVAHSDVHLNQLRRHRLRLRRGRKRIHYRRNRRLIDGAVLLALLPVDRCGLAGFRPGRR